MQNKGLLLTFTILISLICVYQLTFTYKARQVEKRAVEHSQGDKDKELAYLDSIRSEPVYNFFGLKNYTYKEVKERELNLGLDLKGGMNVVLEVSVADLIRALSSYNTDPTFNAAIIRATELQRNSQEDFVTLFGRAFEEVDPNASLAAIFNTLDLRESVKYNSTNAEVLQVIKARTDIAIDNAFTILSTRIDRFGVTQPNIQQLQTKGRILVELPGIDNPERVRNLLKGTASLEFWETYENSEVYPIFSQVNDIVRNIKQLEKPSSSVTPDSDAVAATDATKTDDLLSELTGSTDSLAFDNQDLLKEHPFFAILNPSIGQDGQLARGPIVGTAHSRDTATIGSYLRLPQVRSIIPRSMVFKWTSKPIDTREVYYQLIAIKSTSRDGRAPLTGAVIVNARQDYSQMGGRPEVSMAMNSEGAKVWARMTRDNIGKCIAIVLDDYVRSFPVVHNEITGGRSSISGLESIEEAKDLANILQSGKMPAPAHIIQEEIVGPSLGREAINSGMWSFIAAFALVLIYMLFFYSKDAGLAANVALLFNFFFIMGILASMGAVLTLPGIAGIVLTVGMAVDANVLIYERVQDELIAGKSLKMAVADGYKNAYSAIIDGQVTTLLVGFVLLAFGSGPIKGFATTLIIGIFTSLFTSIFISRYIFENKLNRNKPILFTTKLTFSWLRNPNIGFIANRKSYYILTTAIMLACVGSMAIRGFNYGIDFKGGRTFVVKFDNEVKVADVAESLSGVFEEAPEVKTFGGNNQVKITTDYKVEELSEDIDNEVELLLMQGLKEGGFISANMTKEQFDKDHRQSSQKVGPTISDDIKKDAVISIFLALVIMFIYILIRFTNWQYGLSATLALAHDAIFTMGIFAMFHGILPFSMEIDQAFIAAILTVIAYSVNDTVVIFDRVREYNHLYPKRDLSENMNNAINSTLRRTFSTAFSTLIVLFAIFIFGGTSIRGFCFAMIVGVAIGTYSTVCFASPLVYDLYAKFQKKK